MTPLEFCLLALAGLGAGFTGSIAGLASLISYPALLATGISPVSANVTNTVALVLSGVGSVSASRPELTGQRARLLRLSAGALLGGAAGAALLLLTPTSAFERVVPWLIAVASGAMLVQRSPRELAVEGAQRADRVHGDPWWLPLVTFAVGVYGGYFGAAAGVLLLAVYLLATGEGLPRSNALKNVVLGLANAVAAVAYIVLSPVAWAAGLPLAVGLFCGGLIGPRVVRKVPQTALRRVIAVAGIGLAIRLGLQAYG